MRRIWSITVAILALIVSAGSASAHAKLTTSTPKNGAAVAAGLSKILFGFSKPLRLTVVRVLRQPDGQEYHSTSKPQAAFVDTATVSIEPLPAGSYTVDWTAVASDGHVLRGSIAFSVEEASGAQPAQ